MSAQLGVSPNPGTVDHLDAGSARAAQLSGRRGQLADLMMLTVADIQGATRTNHHTVRPSEGAIDRRNNPAAPIDTAYRIVLGIDNKQAAIRRYCQFLRPVEHRVSCISTVAAVAMAAGASDRLDSPLADAADAAALALHHVQ